MWLLALDGFRILLMLVGALMIGQYLVIGWRLRSTRQWGCYSLACFGAASLIFEWARLRHPSPSPALIFVVLGIVTGLVYTRRFAREVEAAEHDLECRDHPTDLD